MSRRSSYNPSNNSKNHSSSNHSVCKSLSINKCNNRTRPTISLYLMHCQHFLNCRQPLSLHLWHCKQYYHSHRHRALQTRI
uniref:Uncharacterized protein n=1 Tax=Arundo donax TaxID=35708 RepID=A0A0A9E1K1_ARUDO